MAKVETSGTNLFSSQERHAVNAQKEQYAEKGCAQKEEILTAQLEKQQIRMNNSLPKHNVVKNKYMQTINEVTIDDLHFYISIHLD